MFDFASSPAGKSLAARLHSIRGASLDLSVLRQIDAMARPPRQVMTLGRLIEALAAIKNQDQKLDVSVPGGMWAVAEVGSYRGSYEHLGLDYTATYEEAASVAAVLTALRGAVGRVYTGYKGGDYLMTVDTEVWVGRTWEGGGRPIVRVTKDAQIVVGSAGGEEDVESATSLATDPTLDFHQRALERVAVLAWDAALDAVRDAVQWGDGPKKLSHEESTAILAACASLTNVAPAVDDEASL